MQHDIRISTAADFNGVDALLKRSYPVLLKPDYPAEVLAQALPLMTNAQPDLLACGTFYVVECKGQIVAAGGWTPDRKVATRGHIRHVMTDHRMPRTGLGRLVVSKCLETARAAGIEVMECWSTRTAERFYQAMGFRSVSRFDVMLPGEVPFPSIRMEQVL